MAEYNKPIPVPSSESKPYWDGLRDQQVDDAALRRLPGLLVSALAALPALQLRQVDLDAASGRGRIFSYVVYHRVYHPGFADEVPYAVAVIELDEGPRMISNVIGIAPDKLVCDMQVEVVYQSHHRGDHAAEVQARCRLIECAARAQVLRRSPTNINSAAHRAKEGTPPMNAGALEGIRVLEFASYVSGPFAGMLLSDLGAEVVKVEIARWRRSVPQCGASRTTTAPSAR